MFTAEKEYPGQAEKRLEIDAYVNRKGIVSHSVVRTSVAGGDRGVLIGQPVLAGLSLTPRIFGFCGGSHQQAAATALESAWNIAVPPNAQRLRAIAQATEIMQNIPRWFYTTCAPDLVNPKYIGHLLYPEVEQRFAKFKGTSFRPGFMASKYPIALYALLAGQWPHANFIIPGGTSSHLQLADITQAFALLNDFRKNWLEPIWLGCSVERYLEIQTWADLQTWLEEKEVHRNSDLGLFIRTAQEFGLDNLGQAKDQFLSYGAFAKPIGSAVTASNYSDSTQLRSGYFNGKDVERFNYKFLLSQLQIYGLDGINYQNKGVEVGPLARMLLSGKTDGQDTVIHDSLFKDIFEHKGANVFTRILARMHEASRLFFQIHTWLSQLELNEVFAEPYTPVGEAIGLGLTEAPRGALAHYVEVKDQKIKDYKILAPTVINVQSGIQVEKFSPLTAALHQLEIQDLANPIEIGLIARSFDACLSCEINIFKHKSEKKIASLCV